MLGIILTVLLQVAVLEADFTQTKTMALLEEPQVSRGHMVYRSPDYIQWAYLSPHHTVWEMDGRKSNAAPPIQRLLRIIMTSIAEGEMPEKTIERETKSIFKSIHVTMDEKRGVAKRVELTEKNGDTTIIEFTNVITR